MSLPFYTIGHSSRPLTAFVGLLRAAGVAWVADIRTVPKSRTNPQYNKETLLESLAAFQVTYAHIAELGGLRGKTQEVAPNVNGFWENQSFHNYADYAAFSKSFRSGLDRLIALGRERRCAMMCSEAVWWRCHRRIVADHLIARGETVFHLMGAHRIEPARLAKGAQIQPSGIVVYPAQNLG
ncbi:DNA repair protein [Mesorhizobium sp. Root157]|uniref:DUF488 domain-containing protein n=1 Tax=Mesorhizobium sp. Root157 TaxID=1736477 RepID=UPI0006F224CC|nr:DUF488 domain-containing protein [Mesorhizobium sp. Root157]KQZ95903.1 DNA repair protein [Mesorhizobium sp. Root157]